MTHRIAAATAAILAASLLAACEPATPRTGTGSTASRSSVSATGATSSSVAVRPRAKDGEPCGGIAGIQCDPGLICLYDGAYPDAAGTCSK